MKDALLKATELELSYGNHHPVFSKLSFTLNAGEHLGLSGPSGSGKTSLLRLCAGLYGLDHLPVVSGKLMFDNQLDLLATSTQHRLNFRRDVVSMITENPRSGLHPQRTVLQSWKAYGLKSDLRVALEKFGIESPDRISHAYPHELSGGEAQRIRLVFALNKRPKLLLLESPTAALDQENTRLVWEQVNAAKKQGAAILHVDHDLQLLEKQADSQFQLGEELTGAYPQQSYKITAGAIVLDATDVCVSYDGFRAVKSMNLELRAGEFVALLGRSGSGKSSLGKALSGIQPASGRLSIEGEISAFAKTPYSVVDTRVQYIWQEARMSMNPRFSVAKTLEEAIGERPILPETLLKWVDLSKDKLSHRTLQLSTGEQQRLAIARALAVNPKVLVCDEITSGLDRKRAQHVLNTLHLLRKDHGIAVLFITHDEHLAQTHSSRAIRMS